MSGAGQRRLLLGFTLVAAVFFAALGVWQVERLQWKRALIARVAARVGAAPIAPPAGRLVTREGDEYAHVQVTGEFAHDRETLVQAVTELGPGYWVMTPLRTAAGVILINRGFVPPERAAPLTRRAGQSPGQIRVAGLLRLSEPGGGFLRHNNSAANRWYSRDVAAIAAARGLGRVAPYFIDADGTPNPGGWPRGGLTVVQFRNAHLSYALTWFALAAGAAFAARLVARSA